MYRNVNDPKRISPYDLVGIARLSSTPIPNYVESRFFDDYNRKTTDRTTSDDEVSLKKNSKKE